MDVRDQGPVRILTFDRPEKLNALDADLADRVTAALVDAADDDSVVVVVLTGTGRGFCAGVDLDHLAAITEGRESSGHTVAFNEVLRSYEKPVIAAVNGMAVGIGTTMCLHVDLVIAAESARFRTPFTKIGVAPEIGSSWLLPQQVGYQRAAWMLLSSDWVDAVTAVEWGLAFEVVADEALVGRAVELGVAIAANQVASIGAVKRTLRAWREGPIGQAIETENAEFSMLLAAGPPTMSPP